MIDVQPATAVPIAVIGGRGTSSVFDIAAALPEHVGLAVVIACTGGNGDVASTLRERAVLPVVEVSGRTHVERDRIYVVADGDTVLYERGELVRDNVGQRAPLDRLLRSVADELGRHCAAVILAGNGVDGTLGVKRIREVGGLTIAQRPDPASTIDPAFDPDIADMVLDANEIPNRLCRLGAFAEPATGPEVADTLRDILTLLRIRTGHDFSAYKRATLIRRVARRMQVCEAPSIISYHQYLRDRPGEIHNLLRDFLISVTSFFRDPDAFEALAKEVMPRIFAGKSSSDQVRVWAAGCATGEEAYSLAMLLAEQASRMHGPPALQVFATDIDEDALAEARYGRYPDTIAVDVRPDRIDRFFVRENTDYRVSTELREIVLFSPHNVLRDPPFSRLDLVACRNLLIYLNRDAQDRVVNVFHFALRPEGFLFLGSSESFENTGMFHPVDVKARIFARQPAHSSLGIEALTVAGRWNPAPLPVLTSTTRALSYGELHHRLVEAYAPPSVIVSPELDVVHVSEHAGKFLKLEGGEPTRQLLRLVHPALRLDLRTAIFAAKQTGAVETRTVRFQEAGDNRTVELRVQLVELAEAAGGTLLIIFDEQDRGAVPSGDEVRAPYVDVEPVVKELEDDLHRTRDQLRTTIEQYETSLEELKASNEELQAINEELRSATEELETSKEELQSINEELTTVNHELKLKVDEVSHANSDLQNLMTSTDIAVLFLDRSLNIKRFTPRVQDLFNVIPSDIGRPLAHLTHKLESDDLPFFAERVLADLRSVEREVRTKTGRRYLARLVPYRSLEDHIEGVVVTLVEVTEVRDAVDARDRAEASLRVTEERLRIALAGAPIMVISLTSDGEATWVFAHGRALDHSALVAMLEPEQRAHLAALVRDVAEHGSGRRAELALVVDREPRIYDFWFAPATSGVSAVGFDITQAKQSELSLVDADRRKDEFLATLSHELRNPLTPLRVALDVARLSTSPAQQAQSFAIMDRQVTQLTSLIDELLDLSRISQGKIELSREIVDIAAVVEAALEATRPLIQLHRHQLRIDLPRVGARVVGDKSRLVQVLVNLIINAAKYTPDGGRIAVEVETTAASQLIVHVRDNGVGIELDMLPRIFDIFVQSRDALGRSQGGLGIGLNLVWRLVALHGGNVTATSPGPNQGSTFTVELPLAR